MVSKPSQFSLADFFAGDNQNPLIPPEEFTPWREATVPAFSLYEVRAIGKLI